jgi:hypothetical protein
MCTIFKKSKYYSLNSLNSTKIVQYNSTDVRQLIICIVRYLVNLNNFKLLKKYDKKKLLIYNRLMVFMLVPRNLGVLNYYGDRKNYIIILNHLWKFNKYLHLLNFEDSQLFIQLCEFLIDYLILCDNIKSFRQYFNMSTSIYTSSIQLLFGNCYFFTQQNFSKFLVYYDEKKLDKKIYQN